MPDRLLNFDELAWVLGVSRSSIYRYFATVPDFPQPMKVGGATRFRESDVQRFIRGEAANGKRGSRHEH